MEEKYKPVCKGGGLYHSRKVEYSKETKEFVKKLLDESKLSVIQRENVKKVMNKGAPLPKPIKLQRKVTILDKPLKPRSSTKRSLKDIAKSGAYEREKFAPITNKTPYEKEKSRLQSLMAYGKDAIIPVNSTKKPKRATTTSSEVTKDETFDNLVLEIEEREQFLEDMEKLGQLKKYNDVIVNEIASKMNQLEILDKNKFQNLTGTVQKYREKFKKSTNKLYWSLAFSD